ncbi:MAG: DTW domain-containing protein [Deltaproteobacteria bacterium]|nr:DTW domain-containing protein [Deltaproteobacteria bacterium]MBI3295134.1 DTW domain-containing protein [Deltaproteobacteria bacterium]
MSFNTKIIENAGDLRPRCSRCLLLSTLCLCSQLPSLRSRVRLSLMVQWSEYWRLSNSGRLAGLCLPKTQLLMRGKPGGTPLEDHTPNSDENCLLLFPGPGVEVLSPGLLDDRPTRLYVPDGTWREASKIARKTNFLRGMRRAQLPLGMSSRYRLRKAPRAGGVSTIEAIAEALAILGEAENADRLIEVLTLLVNCLGKRRPSMRLHAEGAHRGLT